MCSCQNNIIICYFLNQMLDLKIKHLKKIKSNLISKTMEYTKMENEIINTESVKKY